MAREKVQHWGQGVGVARLPPGGVLHIGRPPDRKRSTPMFWPLPSGDQSKVSKLEYSWKKTAVKVYYAKKTLQLFDILRGWAVFDSGGMIGRGG